MKKTKLFSRIFAAALAAAITATTLITNSGTGLLAFAEDDPPENTYSVKIISPDVPKEDGKTYTYKFYQILKGDVEDNGSENTIANVEWGDAFGSTFTSEEIVIAHQDGLAEGEEADLKLTKDQILIAALDGNVEDDIESSYRYSKRKWYDAILNLHKYFYNSSSTSYGLFQQYTISTSAADPLKGKFDHIKNSDKTALPRTAAGFAEALYKNVMNDGPAVKALTDLIYNGIPKGKETDVWPVIKFLDPAYDPKKVDITGDEELTVRLEPGYYLIACVDGKGNLTNNGAESPKPVSAMLLLVGPNEEANTIVGKNTTAVATVDLKMFYKTIGLEDLPDEKKYGTNVTKKMAWADDSAAKTDIFTNNDTNWVDRASYGNLQCSIRPNGTTSPEDKKYEIVNNYTFDEYVLYRVDVTLPDNFESYADIGYFLAVLGDWDRTLNNTNNSKVSREQHCRPSVYYMRDGFDEPKYVCEIGFDINDEVCAGYSTPNTSGSPYFGRPLSYASASMYKDDSAAKDIMYLGDLFNKNLYGEGVDDAATTDKDERTIPFKGGDHIYIYFPAYYSSSTVSYANNTNLVKPVHAWAVYSNNPHSAAQVTSTKTDDNLPNRYDIEGHFNIGDVGKSKSSETNINTYSLKVDVSGSVVDTSGNKQFKAADACYTLYRVNDDGEKEYALLHNGYNNDSTCYIVGWYTVEQMDAYFNGLGDGVIDDEGKIICNNNSAGKVALSSKYHTFYFKPYQTAQTDVNGKYDLYYRYINGFAPGTYYIEELTIGTEKGDNLSKHNYEQATKPFKVTIGQTYNVDNKDLPATPFSDANKNYLIGTLTAKFEQDGDDKDRTIDTKILFPFEESFKTNEDGTFVLKDDGTYEIKSEFDDDGYVAAVLQFMTGYAAADTEKKTPVKTEIYATTNGLVEVQIIHNSLKFIWLPETGGIGTMIFYIVGGTIVLAATVLIVTRFRVKRERL